MILWSVFFVTYKSPYDQVTFVSLFSNKAEIQNCMIYLCATMWHETYDEMLKILTSMFRYKIKLLVIPH